MKMPYWSEHTENRLNILAKRGNKDNEQTGRLRECLSHGRRIEHGYLLSEASLDLFRFGVQ